MTSAITIRLGGVLALIGQDGTPVDGLSRRGQAMLAYLSQQNGMRAERGLLADLLWSDRGEDQARASLRQEMSLLRRALPDGVLNANRQHVWLDASLVECGLPLQGEGFMTGFDLGSEGFEDWLREARSRSEALPPAASDSGQFKRSVPKIRNRPSLAVFPFEEYGAATDDMFAGGVVEEITGALSRIHDFHVIARQSAVAVHDARMDVQQAAERLGVDYLVQGSVRRSGARVRISVQLVNGADGRSLWSERFDDQLDDLFDLQDRIATQVASQLLPNLRSAEIKKAQTHRATDRTAYELVMSALPHFWAHRLEENVRAIALIDRATDIAPNYALALSLKAWCLAQRPSYLWSVDPVADKNASLDLAKHAARDAGDHVLTLVGIGAAISMCSPDTDHAREILDRALVIDPNNAWGWMRLGFVNNYEGKAEHAVEAFLRAMELSPVDPFLHNMTIGMGVAEFQRGNLEKAADLVKTGMRMGPGVEWALRPLAAIYAGMDEHAEAKAAIEAFQKAYPAITISKIVASMPPKLTQSHPAYLSGLRTAGIPDH